MKTKIHEFPTSDKNRITVVRACEMDLWEGVCKLVRERCRKAYANYGYMDNPYQVGDLRRWEWIEESVLIMREDCQSVIDHFDSFLTNKPLHETGKVLSFNDGKRIVKWNGEYVRI